eukprot:scaffold101322_cov47-Phaeocystis_antarctica.AAC.1
MAVNVPQSARLSHLFSTLQASHPTPNSNPDPNPNPNPIPRPYPNPNAAGVARATARAGVLRHADHPRA